MPEHGFQEDLLHHLPRHYSQVDLPTDPDTPSHPYWIWSWCLLFSSCFIWNLWRQWPFKDEQGNSLVTIAPNFCRMPGCIVLSPINVYTSKLLKWSPVWPVQWIIHQTSNTPIKLRIWKAQGQSLPQKSKKSLECCFNILLHQIILKSKPLHHVCHPLQFSTVYIQTHILSTANNVNTEWHRLCGRLNDHLLWE